MPPRGVESPKRKRQYKKVLSSIRSSGRYKGRQKEVAARIVNKTKRQKDQTRSRSRKSGSSRSPSSSGKKKLGGPGSRRPPPGRRSFPAWERCQGKVALDLGSRC